MTRETATGDDQQPFFSATLMPHRSLGRGGFLVVMALLAGVSFVAGIAFLMIGAWPVLGFFGLDILLILFAFRMSYRSARAYETVELSKEALVIRRYSQRGDMTEVRMNPYWARFHMDCDEETVTGLRVAAEGRTVALGSFLPPCEKRDFGRAFGKALKSVSVLT